jgi:excisionase family DNA binding protein
MKYVVHLTEEDLKHLISQSIAGHFERLERILDSMAEARDNELLKIEEVMRLLKVSKKTVNNWVKQKKLRCHWLGGKLYFKHNDVMDALQKNF